MLNTCLAETPIQIFFRLKFPDLRPIFALYLRHIYYKAYSVDFRAVCTQIAE